jgi:crotonobetainyl-CoA:carnitine CoA-transferase CaiB-like acyl-CoA transferase
VAEENSGILSGIRVLDFTQYIAGPILGRMLADLGAAVIKLEMAPAGDYARLYPPLKAGQGGLFISDNRGKQSLCFHIKRPEAIGMLHDLVRRSDVLVENFTPGVLAKYGLGYEALRPLNPRLIMCSISGFGQNGPYAHKPSNDLIAWASSGLLDQAGYPDQAPVYPGGNMGDCTGGLHGLAAVNGALFARDRTGRGQHIDIALMECMSQYNSLGMVGYGMNGERPVRSGSHSMRVVPFGIFKARDGYVALSVLIHQWETFARLMGQPELSTDSRYDTLEHRMEHKAEVIEIVERWLQSFATRAQPLALLEQAHILSAPVMDTPGVMDDPHTIARRALGEIDQPGIGKLRLPVAPFRFSEAKVEIPGRAPLLGEHNETVLAQVAGYTAAQITALREAGVLHEEAAVAEYRASQSAPRS